MVPAAADVKHFVGFPTATKLFTGFPQLFTDTIGPRIWDGAQRDCAAVF